MSVTDLMFFPHLAPPPRLQVAAPPPPPLYRQPMELEPQLSPRLRQLPQPLRNLIKQEKLAQRPLEFAGQTNRVVSYTVFDSLFKIRHNFAQLIFSSFFVVLLQETAFAAANGDTVARPKLIVELAAKMVTVGTTQHPLPRLLLRQSPPLASLRTNRCLLTPPITEKIAAS